VSFQIYINSNNEVIWHTASVLFRKITQLAQMEIRDELFKERLFNWIYKAQVNTSLDNTHSTGGYQQMCPTPTQHPDHNASPKVNNGSPEGGPQVGSQGENTRVPTASIPTPFFHTPMILPFNPLYYWPYIHPIMVVNQLIPFPIASQMHTPYFLCPFPGPAAAWYYYQQSMMNIPMYGQPVPTPASVTPHGQGHIAQSINVGSGTAITNIVYNEIGDDNSTNVEINKNGTLHVDVLRTRAHWHRSSKHRFRMKVRTLSSFFFPVYLFAVLRNYGTENKNVLHLSNRTTRQMQRLYKDESSVARFMG